MENLSIAAYRTATGPEALETAPVPRRPRNKGAVLKGRPLFLKQPFYLRPAAFLQPVQHPVKKLNDVVTLSTGGQVFLTPIYRIRGPAQIVQDPFCFNENLSQLIAVLLFSHPSWTLLHQDP